MDYSVKIAEIDCVESAPPAKAPLRPEKIRTLIFDSHPIVREGIAHLLNAEHDLALHCETGNAEHAHALMASFNPALVLIDISLKETSGLDLIKSLRRCNPTVRLLAMSHLDELMFAERAMRAGADGYFMKQEATIQILHAIRRVLAGEVSLSDALYSRISCRLTGPNSAKHSSVAGLTEREFEVLHLLGLGFGTRQIAEKLNRSVKTIESHRGSLKNKLKLDNATELFHFAMRLSEQTKDFA